MALQGASLELVFAPSLPGEVLRRGFRPVTGSLFLRAEKALWQREGKCVPLRERIGPDNIARGSPLWQSRTWFVSPAGDGTPPPCGSADF